MAETDTVKGMIASLRDLRMLEALERGYEIEEKGDPKGGEIQKIKKPLSPAFYRAVEEVVRKYMTAGTKPAEGSPHAKLMQAAAERQTEIRLRLGDIVVDPNTELDDTGADSAVGAV